jgi:hypothetical protein
MQSIYSRYAIADESMLRNGAKKFSILHVHEAQTSRVVVPGLVRIGQSPGKGERVRARCLRRNYEKEMVDREGVEPPKPGFSVLRPGEVYRTPLDTMNTTSRTSAFGGR